MSGAPSSGFDLGDLPKRERVGLATSLIGGTLPSAIAKGAAGLLGASDFSAALAGDAFMPGALGADGEGVPSWGSKIGGRLRDPKLAQSLFGGMAAAQSMHQGGRDRTLATMNSFRRPENNGPPVRNTLVNPLDPNSPEYRRWLAMLHGGYGPG